MKLRKKLNADKNFMYCIFWLMLMFGKGLNLAGEDSRMQALTYVAIAIVIVGSYNIKFTKKEFIFCVLLLGMGVIVMVTAKKATILLTALAICTAKRQNIRTVIKIGFWVRMPMFLITVYLATHGMIENSFKYETRNGIRIMRYGLGLGHPNIAHLTLFILVTMYVYLYYEKIGMKSVILIEAINLWLYRYTSTRTGFVLTLMLPLTVLFVKVDKSIFKLIKKGVMWFLVHSYLLISVGSFMLTIISSNKYLREMTIKLLGSRIACANDFITKYPFSLFGHYIDSAGTPLDNAYMYAYVAFGSVTFFLLIFGYTKLLKQYQKENKTKEILILGFFAIYGFSENFVTNVIMNYSLLFVTDMIFDKSRRKVLQENRVKYHETGKKAKCYKEYQNWIAE